MEYKKGLMVDIYIYICIHIYVYIYMYIYILYIYMYIVKGVIIGHWGLAKPYPDGTPK